VWGREVPYTLIRQDLPGNLYGIFGQGPHTLSLYDGAGIMRQRNRVLLNNYGWFSKRDYTVAKSPEEFRIALLGDSMTGTATNTRIWADTLEDLLNDDRAILAAVGKKRITVLNFGLANAGFEFMYYPEAHIAFRFSPDLVIVNYITEDISRLLIRAEDVSRDPRTERVTASQGPPRSTPLRLLDYGDIRVPVTCTTSIGTERECTALPMWQVAQGRTIPPDEMQRVKRAVAKEMIWRQIMFSPQLLLPGYFLEQAAPGQVVAAATDDSIARAVTALEYIRRLHPRLVLAHVPTFDYLSEGYLTETLERFESAAAAAGFTSERTDRRMPIHFDRAVIKRWFNLPHDGHWSDQGADWYAAALHRLLREQLLSDTLAPLDDGKCQRAFARFEEGSVKTRAGEAKAALAALTSAIALLPDDVDRRFAAATAFSECGFAAALYRQAAAALVAAGDFDAADRVLNKGLALEPDSAENLLTMTEAAIARGAGTTELFERLRTRAAAIPEPIDRVNLLLRSGGLARTAGKHVEAERVYREVLVIVPNHLPALDGLSAAYLSLQRPQDAIGQLNAALGQAPDRVDLLLRRVRALMEVGAREQALADLARIPPAHPEAAALRKEVAALPPVPAVAAASASPPAASPPMDRVDGLLRSGGSAATAGNHAEAERIYRQVLVLMPNHLPALEGRAAALMSLGRPQDALSQLNAAIPQAPGRADLRLRRARAFMALNQRDQALDDLATIPPSNTEAAAMRASLSAR
jgi:tetratricopeptide (TPR) repeat protein